MNVKRRRRLVKPARDCEAAPDRVQTALSVEAISALRCRGVMLFNNSIGLAATKGGVA